MEGAKLVQRSPIGDEQVPHQVLDAAGEQVADSLRALEDRPHPLGQVVHDLEAEARADRALAAVAVVQIEALERVGEILGSEPGSGVGDRDQARRRPRGDAAAGRRDPERVLDLGDRPGLIASER